MTFTTFPWVTEITCDIDNIIVTDNGDSEKVLATVVAAIYAFCYKFSKA